MLPRRRHVFSSCGVQLHWRLARVERSMSFLSVAHEDAASRRALDEFARRAARREGQRTLRTTAAACRPASGAPSRSSVARLASHLDALSQWMLFIYSCLPQSCVGLGVRGGVSVRFCASARARASFLSALSEPSLPLRAQTHTQTRASTRTVPHVSGASQDAVGALHVDLCSIGYLLSPPNCFCLLLLTRVARNRTAFASNHLFLLLTPFSSCTPVTPY